MADRQEELQRVTRAVVDLTTALEAFGATDYSITFYEPEAVDRMIAVNSPLSQNLVETFKRGMRFQGSIAGVPLIWPRREDLDLF